MKSVLQTSLMSVGAGFVLYFTDRTLGSTFLKTFLRENLVTILFALLAINGATLGVVLTKIRDLLDAKGGAADFNRTRREMLLSIREQVALIPISVLLLMVQDSKFLAVHPSLWMICDVLVVSCLAYALCVLYDTTVAVFVLLDLK